MKSTYLLVLVAVFTLVGCKSGPGGSRALAPGPWALVEVNARPVPVMDAVRQPTLRFEPADGRVSGNAGVNRFSGSFTRDGSNLSFGTTAATKMAGPPELMKLEEEFLGILPRVRSWRMESTWLVLLDENGTVLARLVPGSTPVR